MRHFNLLPLLAAVLLIGCASTPEPAHATTNLALTCFSTTPQTKVPTTCTQGWTWHTPGKGVVVKTQGGSWKVFTVPPAADLITLCAADLSAGAAQSACPAASVVYLPGCNAATFNCNVTTPDAPASTPGAVVAQSGNSATINWLPPTQNTDGSTLTNLDHYDLFRGAKADGTDATKYQTIAGANSTSYVDGPLAVGNYCYNLTAVTSASISSDHSNVACKAIAALIPTIALAVSPTDGVGSVSPVLTWSSSNATACTASGAWTGTQALSGTFAAPAITASATYTLTCTGAGGSATISASVNVSPRPNAPVITVQ